MRRLTSSQQEDAEVNVTPLLDVVFIMLIFFIVTATFLQEQGLGLKSPEKNPEEETRPPPTLLLSVQADGFVRINNLRIIDPRSVQPVVEEFKARKPRGVVLVSAAPDAKAEDTVMVLDQSRRAGVDPAVGLQKEQP